MQKSLRSLVFLATLTLTLTPALHAGVTGTDPRPSSSIAALSRAQKLLSFLGF